MAREFEGVEEKGGGGQCGGVECRAWERLRLESSASHAADPESVHVQGWSRRIKDMARRRIKI